jgi:GT2 family glycosyltransferase
MTQQRRFTAIIPHRNRPAVLAASLAKLQSRWDHWLREIIVVDDGSDQDKTPRAEALGGAVHVVHREHQGPAACRNAAAAMAAGDLLLFLDDDSWPHTGDLAGAIAAFDRLPMLAAIGLRAVIGQLCESGGAFNAFVGCGAAVRKSAFLAVGGFPEDFVFYAEEYALCYRLIRTGFDVRMWSEPAVFHQKAHEGRDSATILTQLVRNNRRLYEPYRQQEHEVARRLDAILEWYQLLGRRLGVAEQVAAAAAEPLAFATVAPCDGATWRRLLGTDLLEELVSEIVARGTQHVSLWPVGKDATSFAHALRAGGVDAIEVLDPENRYAVPMFAGLPVAKAPAVRSEMIVVASFSPGLCWNAAHRQWPGKTRPLWAGFGYVEAGAPPERTVSRYCIPSPPG